MLFFTCLGHDPFFQMESVEKANGSFILISILVTIVRPRIRVSIMPSLQPLQLHQFLNHEKKKTPDKVSSIFEMLSGFRWVSLWVNINIPMFIKGFNKNKGPTVRFVRTLRLPFKAKTLHKTFLKSRKASDSRFLFHHSFLDQLVLTKCYGKNNSLVWSFANTYIIIYKWASLRKHDLVLGRNIITLWCHRNVACM